MLVKNLRVAKGKKAVGAARPGAESDGLCLVRKSVETVVSTANHPCPTLLDEFGEADAVGLGMETRYLLKQTHCRPGREVVVLVAEVVGGDELLGVKHEGGGLFLGELVTLVELV